MRKGEVPLALGCGASGPHTGRDPRSRLQRILICKRAHPSPFWLNMVHPYGLLACFTRNASDAKCVQWHSSRVNSLFRCYLHRPWASYFIGEFLRRILIPGLIIKVDLTYSHTLASLHSTLLLLCCLFVVCLFLFVLLFLLLLLGLFNLDI